VSVHLFPRGEILATAIDVRNMWLHTVYADHSLLITDVVDFAEPHTHSCSRFHNSCVWDVKVGENDCFSRSVHSSISVFQAILTFAQRVVF